jgi:hypothetical protein
MLLVIWQAWPLLPEKIPQHFDLAGRPNRWGGRGSVWVLPGVAVGLYALMSVLQRFPHAFNYPAEISEANAGRLYRLGVSMVVWMKAEVGALLALLSRQQIEVALGRASMLAGWVVPASVVLIFGTIALYVWRMRSGDPNPAPNSAG